MGQLRDKAAVLAKKKAKYSEGGTKPNEKKLAKVTAKAEKVEAHIERRVAKKAAKKPVAPGEMHATGDTE